MPIYIGSTYNATGANLMWLKSHFWVAKHWFGGDFPWFWFTKGFCFFRLGTESVIFWVLKICWSFMVWPAVATNLEFVLSLFWICLFSSSFLIVAIFSLPFFMDVVAFPFFWPHRMHLAFVSLPLVDLYWPSRVRATWGVLGNLALQLQGRPGQKSSATKANSKSSSSLLATCKHQIRKHSNGIWP